MYCAGAARAWALLDGREYVTPVDVESLFLPVVMHRIVFTPSFVAAAREERGTDRRRNGDAAERTNRKEVFHAFLECAKGATWAMMAARKVHASVAERDRWVRPGPVVYRTPDGLPVQLQLRSTEGDRELDVADVVVQRRAEGDMRVAAGSPRGRRSARR